MSTEESREYIDEVCDSETEKVKKPREIRIVLNDYEKLPDNKYRLFCTDIDRLSPCEFVLSFWNENIEDRLVEALRWRKVLKVSDMYRW